MVQLSTVEQLMNINQEKEITNITRSGRKITRKRITTTKVIKKNPATMEAVVEVSFIEAVVDVAEIMALDEDKAVETTKDVDSIKVNTCGKSVQQILTVHQVVWDAVEDALVLEAVVEDMNHIIQIIINNTNTYLLLHSTEAFKGAIGIKEVYHLHRYHK